MEPNNLYVHIESAQDHSFWYGSFIEFSRANSLTPGQMYDICQELEQTGKTQVRGCGSTRYTLRSGIQVCRQRTTGLRSVVRHYLRREPRSPGLGWSVKHQ